MSETATVVPITDQIENRFEQHRVELTRHCYRMLGTFTEAEDAVQDTFLRAWRSIDSYEGRAPLRAWLYQIATNVCLDIVQSRQKGPQPMDLEPEPDPANVVELRDSTRLALMAAFRNLTPNQRSVLILRDVLCWRASEAAELLGTTVASVNSTLQRARAAVTAEAEPSRTSRRPLDTSQLALLTRYVDAFQRYDMDSLVSLLPQGNRLVPDGAAV